MCFTQLKAADEAGNESELAGQREYDRLKAQPLCGPCLAPWLACAARSWLGKSM